MKVKIFSTNLGEVFDPSKDYTADKNIVLNRHPVEKTEGATKGYLDMKMDEFYKTANIQGTINDISVLKLEGPEIVHNESGLWLKKLHNGLINIVVAEIDKYGRVTKSYPLTDEYLDPNAKITWEDIANKPTTIEGYGIKDLASKNKYETIKGKITVTYQDIKTRSPVPYSHLKTIWERSNHEIKIGDIIMKLDNSSNSTKNFLRANGGVVYRKDYPELVTALAGSSAQQATLPNMTSRDAIILETYGLDVTSYIKAK